MTDDRLKSLILTDHSKKENFPNPQEPQNLVIENHVHHLRNSLNENDCCR
jgi:hypothetical protein